MEKPKDLTTKVVKLKIAHFEEAEPSWITESAERYYAAWNEVARDFLTAIEAVELLQEKSEEDGAITIDAGGKRKYPSAVYKPLNDLEKRITGARINEKQFTKKDGTVAVLPPELYLDDLRKKHKLDSQETWLLGKRLLATLRNRRTRKMGWNEGWPRFATFRPFFSRRWSGFDFDRPSNSVVSENSVCYGRTLTLSKVGCQGRKNLYEFRYSDHRGAVVFYASDKYDLCRELEKSYLVFFQVVAEATPMGWSWSVCLTVNGKPLRVTHPKSTEGVFHMGWRKKDAGIAIFDSEFRVSDVCFGLEYDAAAGVVPTTSGIYHTIPMLSGFQSNYTRRHGPASNFVALVSIDRRIGDRLQTVKDKLVKLGGGFPFTKTIQGGKRHGQNFFVFLRQSGLRKMLWLSDPTSRPDNFSPNRVIRLTAWGEKHGLVELSLDQIEALRAHMRKQHFDRVERYRLHQRLKACKRERYLMLARQLCAKYAKLHILGNDLAALAVTAECSCPPVMTSSGHRVRHEATCKQDIALRKAQKARHFIGLSGLVNCLEQTAPKFGTELVIDKPEDAPTQTCSACRAGRVLWDGKLDGVCDACGCMHTNMDVNAAKNQAAVGAAA